jgi:farnesyl-diphosphate farnesyltransferase
MLDPYVLNAQDLLQPANSLRARPLMIELVRKTLDHFREALDYTLAIPAFSVRLRLACLWPILIGLDTLLLLVDNEAWLDPAKVSKVRRNQVYRIIATSLLLVPSNRLLRKSVETRLRQIEERFEGRFEERL